MATGPTIATAWIKVLPSLEGLQAALVRQSRGSVLEPTVRPAKSTPSIFAASAASLASLFSDKFGKTSAPSFKGSMRNILDSLTSDFSISGKNSGKLFTDGFSGFIGPQGVSGYLKLGAATAGAAVLGRAVGKVGGMLTDMGNEWAGIVARVQNAVGSTGDWNDALRQTKNAASEIGVNMSDLADQASRLTLLAPETIPNYSTALKFTSLLNKNMIATGASTEEAASASRQITQALGKGIVNGDELNSIMENAPEIARMLAKHLGVGVGQLKEMGKNSKITGADLRDAVLENAQQINDEFMKMPVTAARAAKMVLNSWNLSMSGAAIKLSTTIGDALKQVVSGGYVDDMAAGLSAELNKVSDHLGKALTNLVNEFGPHLSQAFAEVNLDPLFDKVNEFIDFIGSISFEQLLNGLKMVAFFGTLAFSGILGGMDKMLGKIPFIGQALVGVKKSFTRLFTAVGTASGEAVSAVGRVVSRIGDWTLSLREPIKSMKQVDSAFDTFKKNISNLDFSKTDQKFQRLVDNMFNGAEKVQDRISAMNDYLQKSTKKASYQQIPQAFFKQLVNLENALKGVDTRGTDMASHFKFNFSKVSQSLSDIIDKSYMLRINVDTDRSEDKLRQFRLDIIKDLSLIHVPDFLQEPIASMVATAVNTMRHLGSGITTVFQAIGPKIGDVFTKTVFPLMQSAGTSIQQTFRNALDPVQHYFAETFGTTLGDFVKGIPHVVGDKLVSAVTSIVDRASSAMSAIKGRFVTIANDTSNPFTAALFSKIVSAADKTSSYLTSTVPGAFKRMTGIVGRSINAIGDRFPALKTIASTTFRGIAEAGVTILGKSMNGLGKTITGVGKAFKGIAHFASSLGITAAATSALTGTISTLYHMDPSQFGQAFVGMTAKMTDSINRFTSVAPAMADAFAKAAPDMIAAITQALPSLVNAFGNLVNTLALAVSNNMPMLVSAFTTGLEDLINMLPLILPSLMDAFSSLFVALAQAMPGLLQTLGNAIVAFIPQLSYFFSSALPTMIEAVGNMLTQIGTMLPGLAKNIAQGLPPLFENIANALPNEINSLMQGVLSLITGVIQSLPIVLPALINGVVQLLAGLVNALPQFISTLMPMIPVIIESLAQTLANSVGALIEGAIQLVNALVQNLPTIISTLIQYIPSIITSIVNALTENVGILINGAVELVLVLVQAMPQIIVALVNAMPQVLMKLGGAIVDNFPTIIKAFGDGFVTLAAALPQLIGVVIGAIPRIVGAIAGAFGTLGSRIVANIGDVPGRIIGMFAGAGSWLVDAGRRILQGLLRGLQEAWSGIANFIGGIGNWIVQHKGPPVYDAQLLVHNGTLIMQGLHKGLMNGFQNVQGFIGDVNNQLSNIGLVDPLTYENGRVRGADMGYAVGAYNGPNGKVINQNFPAKIIRQDDDLYTAYPQLQRIAMNEASMA